MKTCLTKRWLSLWVALCVALCLSAPAAAADLTAYSEEWPPYNYLNQHTKAASGLSTEMLRLVCREAQIQCAFHIVPWARAYRVALQTPGALVYTTARKPEREKDFVWLGPIVPRTTWLYTRANLTADVRNPADLANLRVGVVRDEAAAGDLLRLGVPDSAFKVEPSNSDLLRLMAMGAIDAMVDTELGMAWNLKAKRVPASMVQRRFMVSDEGAYFFAINPDTNPVVLRKVEKAFDKLQRNGKLAALVRSYLNVGM